MIGKKWLDWVDSALVEVQNWKWAGHQVGTLGQLSTTLYIVLVEEGGGKGEKNYDLYLNLNLKMTPTFCNGHAWLVYRFDHNGLLLR